MLVYAILVFITTVIGAASAFGLFARKGGADAVRVQDLTDKVRQLQEISNAKARMAAEVLRGPDPGLTDQRLHAGTF